ncbi:hypothetical protein BCR44DRAFT_1435063 [Catenaria anguillulae PL171]|uniref:Uncharacterized protein n=1 Tax=Catenaria anguillulae PL171 TaxID=765915 RepID=A0A1Y2HKI5_9FUNG|nr:hypothetical protein BCR44DRAFT_1435063 [Catenaria anguillulae PL171]
MSTAIMASILPDPPRPTCRHHPPTLRRAAFNPLAGLIHLPRSATTAGTAAADNDQPASTAPTSQSSVAAPATESAGRRPRHLISALRRSATATTDLATPARPESPAGHQQPQHHVRIVDHSDPAPLAHAEHVAAAAEGPVASLRTRSQRPRPAFARTTTTTSNSSFQDSDLAPTPSIPLSPERHPDRTESRRRESLVSTCPTFQSALAASTESGQPANYGTITDPPPSPGSHDQQRARHPSASATLTTTPSLGHSSLSLPDSLPTGSSSDRTLAANQPSPQFNMRKSPSSLLRSLLSPCLSFATTCTRRSSSASSTDIAASRTHAERLAPLHVAYASQVLLRWHRPHHAGNTDGRKSRKESKMVFWREYHAYLLVDPNEPVNNDDDSGIGSTGLRLCFSLSPTHPIHTLPLHTATLALHAPSDLSLSIHASPASSLAWILHSPSLDVGVNWYRAILRALPLARRPHVPLTVEMYLPDAPGSRCAVQVPVDKWELTVAEVAQEALRVLTDESNVDTPVKVRQWVRDNRAQLQVAWRRGDRLWWIPANVNREGGCAYVVGPWFVEKSHVDSGHTKLATAALSIFSTWETRFAMQVGDHGRFLCFSRYPAPHAPLDASPPNSGTLLRHPPAPRLGPVPLLTSTRLVDLLDIRVDRGCELAAGSHAGLHVWVDRICTAIVRVHQARFEACQVYARVLAHNQHVLASVTGTGVAAAAVDLKADARMWCSGVGVSPGAVVVAHRVHLKSKYRSQFRPALLVVTRGADLLVLSRRVAVTSASSAEARSASRRVSGVYKVVRRIGLASGRAHVLVGYVNAKSGVSAVDEMWGEVVGKVWDEEGLGFGEDGSSSSSTTDQESGDEEEEDGTALDPQGQSSATVPAWSPASPSSPSTAPVHPPPITSWLPNTQPPVATVHEGPHQTCFTLWIPPRARDVMKRRRRKGKVYVVECRRKAVRDQFLVAIQDVLSGAAQ